ncbi:snaclec alboaggregin-A subunit beta'-like [Haliotis rubra]|uniref:snaclec alboaggregin-A subunit beta'-like n=1 Tax=Haliotis rubra TaxID=36100 RepID=UPI001EE5EA52|nr:snaclec alboaggregin-A subunit beta'-like [Haliotis rubra]
MALVLEAPLRVLDLRLVEYFFGGMRTHMDGTKKAVASSRFTELSHGVFSPTVMELLCAAVGCLVVCISTCGTHAASYTARYFTYSTTAVSWNTAYTTCSLTGGHLITVDNNVTINVLKYIRAQPEAAVVSNKIWMGLHNTAPTSDVPEYVWADCKHLDDNNSMWLRGEPNDVQTDRCIITTSEYEWMTKPCTQTYSFFCENIANVSPLNMFNFKARD